MNRWIVLPFRLLLLLALLPLAAQAQFDHAHSAWTALLGKHVVVTNGGRASQVRYAGFARDRPALKAYLDSLSRLPEREFKGWTKAQQMAFLINAYNAFTIEKILTRYPDLKSIKDLGGVFSSPWKDKFFMLFGRESYLDQIEHEMLRAKGVYEEPRVHFAVNCASIGCPMLREEAYVADRLEAQLEEQTWRFLSDPTRNRYNEQSGRLEVSKIFDWFKEDWQSGYRGIGAGGQPVDSREQFFARYAGLLADKPAAQTIVAERKAGIAFLDYDWGLNIAPRAN
ncbi:MAG: DUF547 domain-containing protein [Betaproteobacteria bacterium]|nr:DUF547 domain-containing protein [Betaproteobacteria bacterium]